MMSLFSSVGLHSQAAFPRTASHAGRFPQQASHHPGWVLGLIRSQLGLWPHLWDPARVARLMSQHSCVVSPLLAGFSSQTVSNSSAFSSVMKSLFASCRSSRLYFFSAALQLFLVHLSVDWLVWLGIGQLGLCRETEGKQACPPYYFYSDYSHNKRIRLLITCLFLLLRSTPQTKPHVRLCLLFWHPHLTQTFPSCSYNAQILYLTNSIPFGIG